MKFNSLREYFYKLHNLLYAALLPPLILFAFLYLEYQSVLTAEPEFSLTVASLVSVFLLSLLYSLYVTRKRIIQIRKEVSLGVRLEKYASVLTFRFFSLGGSAMILVAGFVLVKDQIFVALFVVVLIVFSVFWPTARRVCNDLKLKGDDRELVLKKKDLEL